MIFSNEIQCWCFIDQNFTRGVLLIFHLPFGVFLMRRNCPLSRISQNSTDNFLSLTFWADLFFLETLVIFFSLFSIFRYVYCRWPPEGPKKMQFNNKTSRVVIIDAATQFTDFLNLLVSIWLVYFLSILQQRNPFKKIIWSHYLKIESTLLKPLQETTGPISFFESYGGTTFL